MPIGVHPPGGGPSSEDRGFRRHVYRYGPILICEPELQATHVISVRY